MTDLNTEALVRYVERIENFVAERTAVNEEIRGVYAEIKQAGMSIPTVRQMLRERALKPEVRANQYRMHNEYRAALGLFADTPLGQAAMQAFEDGDELDPDPEVEWPRPFAQQPVHPPRRARQRKPKLRLFDSEHPQGTA